MGVSVWDGGLVVWGYFDSFRGLCFFGLFLCMGKSLVWWFFGGGCRVEWGVVRLRGGYVEEVGCLFEVSWRKRKWVVFWRGRCFRNCGWSR